MGLKEILDAIEIEGSESIAETTHAAKLKSTRMLMDKQKELDAVYDKKHRHLEDELERLEKKLKAKSELDAKREIIRVRGELIQSFLKYGRESLFTYFQKDSKAYETFLEKAISRSLAKLDESHVLVSLSVKDREYFAKLKKKFGNKIEKGSELKNQNGVICRVGRRIEDWTLESLFEKSRAGLIRLIDKELKKLRS